MNLLEKEYEYFFMKSEDNKELKNKYKKIKKRYKETLKNNNEINKIEILYFYTRYEIFLLLLIPIIVILKFFNNYSLLLQVNQLYLSLLILFVLMALIFNKKLFIIFFGFKYAIKDLIFLILVVVIPFITKAVFGLVGIIVTFVIVIIVITFYKKVFFKTILEQRKIKIKQDLKELVENENLTKNDFKYILQKKRLRIPLFFMITLFISTLFSFPNLIKGPSEIEKVIGTQIDFINKWFYVFLILLFISSIVEIINNVIDISDEERIELNNILKEIYEEKF
ncbi:hypothetical protein [Leptotrichia wadei]|uniref:hypothetical protein n=1 Tax=Leptotrichia wadei TaxID=157687 RepID=UPI0028D6AB3C|nr:hypothetical protein [Leptotrichia wadei]